MQDDLLQDLQGERNRISLFPAGQRHHRRCDHEMQDVFEAEDQRHRNGRRLAQRQKRKPRPHIADIAIGPCQPLYRRFGQRIAQQETPGAEDQPKIR